MSTSPRSAPPPSIWQAALDEREAAQRLALRRARPAAQPAPRVGHVLQRALGERLAGAAPAADSLAARWPEIVGPRLAAVTQPVEVKRGKGGAVLVVRAPSAAAPMIQHAAASILDRATLAAGAKVTSLRIVQTAGPAADAAGSAAGRPGPRPLGAAELERLAEDLAPVASPAVRQALAELGEAVLAWRSPRR
jgi:hypothetical protein